MVAIAMIGPGILGRPLEPGREPLPGGGGDRLLAQLAYHPRPCPLQSEVCIQAARHLIKPPNVLEWPGFFRGGIFICLLGTIIKPEDSGKYWMSRGCLSHALEFAGDGLFLTCQRELLAAPVAPCGHPPHGLVQPPPVAPSNCQDSLIVWAAPFTPPLLMPLEAGRTTVQPVCLE